MAEDALRKQTEERPPPGAIIVGHDGSDGAAVALSEALDLARSLGGPVVLVRAWSLFSAPRVPAERFGYVPGLEEYAEAVRSSLVDDVHEVLEDFPEVSVECRAVHGAPTKALVDLSEGARLLVVGARGLGGLAGMLVGSVSEQCVRHAPCSVLVAKGSRQHGASVSVPSSR